MSTALSIYIGCLVNNYRLFNVCFLSLYSSGSTESSVSPRPSSAPTSFAGDRVPGGGPGLAAGMGVWSGEGSASNGSSLDGSKSSNTTLQPGMCCIYSYK